MTTTKTEKTKRTPKAKADAEKPKRNRRTAEQKIADLLAEVERVREREAAKGRCAPTRRAGGEQGA